MTSTTRLDSLAEAAEAAPFANIAMLGGPSGAGRHLYQVLHTAELNPSLCIIDGVSTLTVAVQGGEVWITGRGRTLAHPRRDHTGWIATLHTNERDPADRQAIVIYEGAPETGLTSDTAACAGAAGALVAIARHLRTTTVSARIKTALLAERGITANEGVDHDALTVDLPAGGALWIDNGDATLDYQAEDYYGVEIWYYPEDPSEGGGRRMLEAVKEGHRGLAGSRADLPAVLDTVENAVRTGVLTL
ncbi:hypothetical protein [Kitasatospora kifunensis]|uniref:Uncharacterized protein n=1 Tax=Kitasatospora kifunensis TaxID=58351 RepID=A0A7W7W0T2_KITKI|nr:hypothetical protein [Kitasatospora kifunensis]MBB4929039.1 hypothetical protein [Kitasatospora kifunensis]